jgi:ATP-dependent helicase YprA (DUF1998 family)
VRPTLEARGLKESLLQYLSTTYALSDEGARESLHRFLGDEDTGMFRGPFLRIRAPFTAADQSWRELLDWKRDDGWTPYAHQAVAFARLSSMGGRTPQPTLVTTGTGSGKTEAFLYPVLDHCARERAAGQRGVKAVFLYPMNALATDQAQRINGLLVEQRALQRLQGGLYIGDRAATRYEKVWTNRSDIRVSPPDILITNYKMLDLLLQRPADRELWADADIRYVVVDEFHTYDGAQGTDVAMLLRRLAAAVGTPEPGRPLGSICPVATSATLGSGVDPDGRRSLLDVATDVFGTAFSEDAVIAEDRQTVEDFLPPDGWDPMLPLPTPDQLAALGDPLSGPDALADLVEAVTGTRETDPLLLATNLAKHTLTFAVMKALDGQVRTSAEVLDLLWRSGAPSWAQAITRQPEVAAVALARVVALLSIARDPRSAGGSARPFVHVEVHQWARSVSRLVRGVLPWPRAEFRWDAPGATDGPRAFHARNAPVTVITAGLDANLFLPAVYCRDCGRSGWAVFSPESDDQAVQFETHRIRRASTSQDKIRVRNLIAATNHEAREGSGTAPMAVSPGRNSSVLGHGTGGMLMVLDGPGYRLRLPDPVADYDPDTRGPRLTLRDSAFVLVTLGDNANTAAGEDWCPACGERNAIRYLGTGAAALAAASITQLFTGGELDKDLAEDKTLMFNDSVQDAAHRAGFVSSRSYTFSLRALLKKHLAEDRPTGLNDLIADVVAATTDAPTLSAVVPADLHDDRGVARLLSGRGRSGSVKTWELIGERLAFETLMEFGFRSRNGRTLELTRTAAAQVRIPDPNSAVSLVRTIHLELSGMPPAEQDNTRYLGFLRVLLERMRTRGALNHRWLNGYLAEAGTSRYHIWGGRPPGMRPFPKGVGAPRFLLAQPKAGSEFDVAAGRLTWFEQWAQRCLEITREQAPEFWNRLLPELATASLMATRIPNDSSARIYGLQPGHVDVRLLTDDEVNTAFVRCPVCAWEQTVHPELHGQWHGQRCPSYRCRTGRLVAGTRPAELGVHHRDRDFRTDYYRDLYRRAGTYQIVTAEHTGLLTRPARERVEAAFKHGTGFSDPNVLSCTPTLEMGIDIGDLSAVVLAALPRRPANYAQQVGRAGRRTGNAFLLTIPDRSRRDMYFLDEPREMIAGLIVPPGCHLSAVEILRRQYLAHLLDLAAAGRLLRPDGRPMAALPPKAPQLFGESGYLADLVEVTLANGESLAGGFLALFPTGVNPPAANDLHDYATRGLRLAVEEAERAWRHIEDVLRARLRLVDDAHGELHDSDPDQARQKAELEAERRTVGKRMGRHGDTDAQTALCDLGLLPNYALIDATTTLNATLYWSEGSDPAAGKERFISKLIPYDRPQRYALSELAPGNTFYVNGFKHEITGMEIGSAARPEWRSWRFCPDCGHVRTDNATEDRTPCPRCGSPRIADDGSCLHQVVEPTVVTSRGKREDARIGDEKDDREQRFYSLIDAVDIPLEAIEPGSWRHHVQTFGVDFCRSAMIRRINVGQTRFDQKPRDDLAGQTVRLSPFHVCTSCGAATADGKPVFDHDTDAVDSSAARNPRIKHHHPWCPLRRGAKDGAVPQEPVLLAHQLRTEALRVLLPAATFGVDEKIHSFRAALRMGVDRHFGGDPQHLDTTLASMPDIATGEKRHYLVLYDRLPGGTGYLHRLVEPAAFRDTLAEARRALLACPCQDEGRRACHRCLHRHTEERHQDIVSRREALDILGDLLGPVDENGDLLADAWETKALPHTGLIGLDRQVESDLEARFLAALRDWVATDQGAALDEGGRDSGYLRFTDLDGVVRWRLTAQQELGYTRTDFTFQRVDGPTETVTVYLDGYRNHATRARNTLADDAEKRTRLRAEGRTVFQVTWDDLDLFEERKTRAEPVWPPYLGLAQQRAKETYEHLGGARAHLADAVFANPIDTLLAYLRRPNSADWARRAAAAVAGLTTSATPVAQSIGWQDAAVALRAVLNGQPVPELAGPSGAIHVLHAADRSGLPLLHILDATHGPAPDGVVWSAIAILDDHDASLDTDGHKQRWRAWLYWSNLLQFLEHRGGDGVQLVASRAVDFPFESLAVGRGTTSGPATPVPTPSGRRDSTWDEDILPLLDDEEEESLIRLAEALAARGKRAPVFGHELGERRWLVDFAWPGPGLNIAVQGSLGAHDEEAQRRDHAYAAAGWTIRTASDWLEQLDSLLDLLPDVEDSDSR